jgi:hypothetical protein
MEADEPISHTTVWQLKSWEEFQERVGTFEDADRKLWDEVWFRGQADAKWGLDTTLERRSKKIRTVEAYFKIMAGIKSAIETFTDTDVQMPTSADVEKVFRKYGGFEFESALRDSASYMVHLRHGGFPSPLLDWTHSPYVAAYFAFSRARNNDHVAIYAYRERPEGFKFGGSDTPQIISFGPLIKTHKRHFRQQSRYTACVRFQRGGQWYFVPHESVFESSDYLPQDKLWKITVPAKERQKALRYFDKFNLNEFTLFDSEEGLLEMLATRAIDMRE